MRIDTLLQRGDPLFSFEFFPPADDDGAARLFDTISALRPLQPAFVSVTHGAGGSRRDDRTVRFVERIRDEAGLLPMAHLTCRDCSVDELREDLLRYQRAGIDNVLALRGDPADGEGTFTPHPSGLRYGSELVELATATTSLCVGAACSPERHPESSDDGDDLRAAVEKVRAGARFLITQLIFDNRVYVNFVARLRAAGVSVPVIPSIMPVTNVDQVERFTSKIGATVPVALREALHDRRDDRAAVIQLGVAWATLQCSDLLRRGAPGVHFITLNRSPATRAILSALRIEQPWRRGSGEGG
ncbi:MAG: methylenetetrahydrofolate reductase [Candidatus Dormibacteria bacterium]